MYGREASPRMLPAHWDYLFTHTQALGVSQTGFLSLLFFSPQVAQSWRDVKGHRNLTETLPVSPGNVCNRGSMTSLLTAPRGTLPAHCSECSFHNNLKQRIQEGASQTDWKANRQKKIATVQFSILHWIPEGKKYKFFLFFLVWFGFFFALSIFLVIDVAGSPGDKSSLISCSTDNKVMYFTVAFLVFFWGGVGVRIFCVWK